jgi:hypothetical protein
MGKKRTHAETKDGFTKPSGHDRMKGGASDRRKPDDAGKKRSALVSSTHDNDRTL